MSATTRLLVLGVVRIFQPVHGYDVRRELASWHAEEWASVAPGSIYNALKTLTKDGFLEVVDTNQVGGRPERTTYRLTPRGDQELNEMLRDVWWTVRMPIDPLAAGVALMPFLQRDEVIAALEARIAHVQGQIAHQEYAIAAIDGVETPTYVRELIRLLNARLAAEIDWARALIPLLRAGEYQFLGDPPWYPGKPVKKSSKYTPPKPTKAVSLKPPAAKAPSTKPRAAKPRAAKPPVARSAARAGKRRAP